VRVLAEGDVLDGGVYWVVRGTYYFLLSITYLLRRDCLSLLNYL
jgi:hypothetical protein